MLAIGRKKFHSPFIAPLSSPEPLLRVSFRLIISLKIKPLAYMYRWHNRERERSPGMREMFVN